MSRAGARIVGALVLCGAAGSAAAQMACTFETECYEQDGCAEAGFTLSLDETGETPVLMTDFGDLAVEELGEGLWLAQSDGLAALLSVGEDGTARASFHLPGPQVVAYLGMCGGE
ncbi:MAG: hypothetical protein AAF366_18615 [Pseudomonadota bacterium]